MRHHRYMAVLSRKEGEEGKMPPYVGSMQVSVRVCQATENGTGKGKSSATYP